MRDVMLLKHYSLRTGRAYCDWVERFIRFHAKRVPREEEGKTQAGSMRYVWRHPREMGEAEVSAFLTHLER